MCRSSGEASSDGVDETHDEGVGRLYASLGVVFVVVVGCCWSSSGFESVLGRLDVEVLD